MWVRYLLHPVTGTFKTTRLLSMMGVDFPAQYSFQSFQNLVNSESWHNCWLWLSELAKFCQQWELSFLSTINVRATKIRKTLRADVLVAFRATKSLEVTMTHVNYLRWKRSISELPKSFQPWESTYLSAVAFIATKIPANLRVDVPVASRAT